MRYENNQMRQDENYNEERQLTDVFCWGKMAPHQISTVVRDQLWREVRRRHKRRSKRKLSYEGEAALDSRQWREISPAKGDSSRLVRR